MCIEFSLKRAGMPIIRNFLHGSEGVLGGLPAKAQTRLQINYVVKTFKQGKATSQTTVDSLVSAFPCKGDSK